jgi:hypothetical protein
LDLDSRSSVSCSAGLGFICLESPLLSLLLLLLLLLLRFSLSSLKG